MGSQGDLPAMLARSPHAWKEPILYMPRIGVVTWEFGNQGSICLGGSPNDVGYPKRPPCGGKP
jgi:hypothetical protein